MNKRIGRRGAAGMQYGMVLGLIAVAAVVAIATLGSNVRQLFTGVSNRLTNAEIQGGGGSGGATGAAPTSGTSCKSLRQGGQTADGVYSIDADGSGPDAPLQMYCNMSWDGGGWTLALVQSPSTNWSSLTPSKTSIPTDPLITSGNVLHYDHVTAIGTAEMMVLSSNGSIHRIIKLYHSAGSPTIVVGYRRFTQRTTYDLAHYAGDGPHSGLARVNAGSTTNGSHADALCATADWAVFKGRSSCGLDQSNSHPSWNNSPGNGSLQPVGSNCWFFGGSGMAELPQIINCPAGSQAPFANYTVTGSIGSGYTTQLWVR